jgi:hypothetical protein
MRTPGLMELCAAIEGTPLSAWIQDHGDWFIPTVQVIHIMAIAAILIASSLINLRILGSASTDHSLSFVVARFSPILRTSLVFLILSGILLIVGEPARSLANSAFQFKMICLMSTLLIFWIITRALAQDEGYWQKSASRQSSIKVLAMLSIILWVSIVFAGRWIAYL